MPIRDIPQTALDLIKAFEGIPDGDPTTVNLDPYLDPVGIWTIGWGHAIAVRGRFLRGNLDRKAARDLYPGGIALEQAEALLRADLIETARDVPPLLRVDVNNSEFGALVSFAFNLGVPALAQSTLRRLLNAGDRAGAADQFLRWTKGTDPKTGQKKDLPGLIRRRAAERKLFLGRPWSEP